LEAQQHKKYAQTTPLDDGVSSLFKFFIHKKTNYKFKTFARRQAANGERSKALNGLNTIRTLINIHKTQKKIFLFSFTISHLHNFPL
jgi:hypothetical protein